MPRSLLLVLSVLLALLAAPTTTRAETPAAPACLAPGALSTERLYCPEAFATRAEMAVFLIRVRNGPAFAPAPPDGVFVDVPTTHWAAGWIEAAYHAGLTAGCGRNEAGNLLYCPERYVTRAEAAVFVVRLGHGTGFVVPPATGTVFADVPASYWAAPWIEQARADGYTNGCGLTEAGDRLYCPERYMTRAELAVFLVRLELGTGYTPDPATGAVFADVPASHWAAAWIEELYAQSITRGCA